MIDAQMSQDSYFRDTSFLRIDIPNKVSESHLYTGNSPQSNVQSPFNNPEIQFINQNNFSNTYNQNNMNNFMGNFSNPNHFNNHQINQINNMQMGANFPTHQNQYNFDQNSPINSQNPQGFQFSNVSQDKMFSQYSQQKSQLLMNNHIENAQENNPFYIHNNIDERTRTLKNSASILNGKAMRKDRLQQRRQQRKNEVISENRDQEDCIFNWTLTVDMTNPNERSPKRPPRRLLRLPKHLR